MSARWLQLLAQCSDANVAVYDALPDLLSQLQSAAADVRFLPVRASCRSKVQSVLDHMSTMMQKASDIKCTPKRWRFIRDAYPTSPSRFKIKGTDVISLQRWNTFEICGIHSERVVVKDTGSLL